MLDERIATLTLEIDDYELRPLQSSTSSGWTRHSTVVALRGAGHEGLGEDVTYEKDDQLGFQATGGSHDLRGRMTFDEFSRRLDAVALFAAPPTRTMNRLYRRWAFESAALDLALRQNGLSLAAALDREFAPLRYVVSLGLGSPPSTEPLQRIRDSYPGAEFKVDLSPEWTAETARALEAFGGVTTIDLKGQYHGSFEGPPANATQYRAVAELLPEAWIEDPSFEAEAYDTLTAHLDRVTWDANIHSVADVVQLPTVPRCVNIKPSRFGFVSELLRCYEFCESRGMRMYGGGQFELGAGRGQIQYLASLFHPDGANDVAPLGFNRDVTEPGMPTSPMTIAAAPIGFRADSD